VVVVEQGVESTAHRASHIQSVRSEKPASKEMPPQSDGPPKVTSPIASAPSVEETAAIRNDSTYDKMLAFAQADPRQQRSLVTRSADQVEPANVDPFAPLRADWPGDLPLRRQAVIDQPVGDRFGIIVTYRREVRKQEATSP
jgi:hypothetical protein